MTASNPGPSATVTANQTAVLSSSVKSSQFYNGIVPTRLISFGDSLSINTGVGSNTAGQMYVSQVAARYSPLATFVPTAVSGVVHATYLNTTLTALLNQSTDLYFGLPMFNTMRFMGPNPALTYELLPAIEAFLAWMGLPESVKVRAVNAGTTTINPGLTTTGSGWAYFSLNGSSLANLCIRDTTANDTATFPTFVNCDTIYLWYARGTLSDTGTNSVFVDGLQYNISQFSPYNSFLSSFGNWEPALLRITGLNPNQTHTLKIQVPTSGAVNIIAAAGFNSQTIAASAPAVVTGNCLKMITGVSSSGYASAATANDPLSNNGAITLSAGTVTVAPYFYGHAGVVAYNTLIARAVANLAGDGLRIALIDFEGDYITFNSTMVDPDTVHPNVGGMGLIYRRFAQVISPLFGNTL